MFESDKISSFQMGVMMYPTLLSATFLAYPAISAQYANNDLWLTGIFIFLLGSMAVYVGTKLHELYPQQTIIQYSEHIVGVIPGKMISLTYIYYLLQDAGTSIRLYAEFVVGSFLFKTPILIVISTMILLAAFAVRGGVELLCRSAVILTPIFILPIFFLLLLFPSLDLKNIFPILSHGILPVIKGTQVWIGELFLMAFFLPHLADPKKGKKWGFLVLIAIVCSVTYVNLMILLLLGPDANSKVYPILIAFRYIQVANFFENLESLLLAMWVVGNFIKIGVFYYLAVLSFGQWLKLSDYRPVIFPLGVMIAIFSLWSFPSYESLGTTLRDVAPFHIAVNMFIIPLILLIIAVLRKRKMNTDSKNS